MTVVSLTNTRNILMPGIMLMSRMDDAVGEIPEMFPLVRQFVKAGYAAKIRDFIRPPNDIELESGDYSQALVWCSREYPQGWGRGPGGAAAEPPPEADGKVDTFKMHRTAARKRLDQEISEFLDWYLQSPLECARQRP